MLPVLIAGAGSSAIAVTRDEITLADASGNADGLTLYRFSPAGHGGPYPAVLLFHGGGWRRGSPGQLFYCAKNIAESGFVVYSAQYRLIGKDTQKVDDCIADAVHVFNWIREHAQTQNIDPQNIFVGGASAGGQLALYVFLKNTGAQNRCRGFIGYNPVVDVDMKSFSKIFKDTGEAYNPMTLLDHQTPPMLIFHGTDDNVVPIEEVYAFKSKAAEFDVQVEVSEFEGASHGFFNYSKSTSEERKRMSNEALIFLQSNLVE